MSAQCTLTDEAVNEIASCLPNVAGKTVVVLNGRSAALTSRLAQSAHVECKVDETGSLQPALAARSADLIVSVHCAFANLTNAQVQASLLHLLDSLKVGGHLFLLEECFARRTPIEYAVLLEQAIANGCGFEVERASLLKAAVQQGKFDFTWWLLRKVEKSSDKIANPGETQKSADQQFLDGVQYSVKGILKYERIFGVDYVSTGGEYTTRQFCETLRSLQKRADGKPIQVLDIGCGTGGSAFFMYDHYGAETLGIDLSVNMTSIAFEKQREKKCRGVQFLVADATQIEFEEGRFDLIYSRDAILHISDKLALFRSFHKWLKPGGEVFITDYCATDEKQWSAEFKEYVAQRGYHLLSTTKYGDVLREAGFADVRAINNTTLFVSILRRELDAFAVDKQSFLRDFTQADHDSIVNGWTDKIRRCEQMNEQHWGAFYATKL